MSDEEDDPPKYCDLGFFHAKDDISTIPFRAFWDYMKNAGLTCKSFWYDMRPTGSVLNGVDDLCDQCTTIIIYISERFARAEQSSGSCKKEDGSFVHNTMEILIRHIEDRTVDRFVPVYETKEVEEKYQIKFMRSLVSFNVEDLQTRFGVSGLMRHLKKLRIIAEKRNEFEIIINEPQQFLIDVVDKAGRIAEIEQWRLKLMNTLEERRVGLAQIAGWNPQIDQWIAQQQMEVERNISKMKKDAGVPLQIQPHHPASGEDCDRLQRFSALHDFPPDSSAPRDFPSELAVSHGHPQNAVAHMAQDIQHWVQDSVGVGAANHSAGSSSISGESCPSHIPAQISSAVSFDSQYVGGDNINNQIARGIESTYTSSVGSVRSNSGRWISDSDAGSSNSGGFPAEVMSLPRSEPCEHPASPEYVDSAASASNFNTITDTNTGDAETESLLHSVSRSRIDHQNSQTNHSVARLRSPLSRSPRRSPTGGDGSSPSTRRPPCSSPRALASPVFAPLCRRPFGAPPTPDDDNYNSAVRLNLYEELGVSMDVTPDPLPVPGSRPLESVAPLPPSARVASASVASRRQQLHRNAEKRTEAGSAPGTRTNTEVQSNTTTIPENRQAHPPPFRRGHQRSLSLQVAERICARSLLGAQAPARRTAAAGLNAAGAPQEPWAHLRDPAAAALSMSMMMPAGPGGGAYGGLRRFSFSSDMGGMPGRVRRHSSMSAMSIPMTTPSLAAPVACRSFTAFWNSQTGLNSISIPEQQEGVSSRRL